MGISHDPIIGVGKVFDYEEEAIDWYSEKVDPQVMTKINEEYEGSLSEYLYSEGGDVEGTCLNLYSGYGFIIYIPLEIGSAGDFAVSLQNATTKWLALFKEGADIVHEVCVS